MTEHEDAIRLANKVLDTPHRDPDDDLVTLARQFLRAIELRTGWKPLAKHPGLDKEGRRAMHALLWARCKVWPYNFSPAIERAEPYWTDWKAWRCYYAEGRWQSSPQTPDDWRIGTEPRECQVLKIQATHYMDLPDPPEGAPTGKEEPQP